MGTKFFVDHGVNTNAHNGRKPVGEILTSFVKDIGGKLSNVIIGHFPNAEEVKNNDVCSMEADIQEDKGIVDDVNEVSGIALGNSEIDNPAFSGAFRLNTIQCFDTENNNSGEDNMAKEKPTFGEIKMAVREMNIYPWQLYSEDDLKKDNTFKLIFEENKKFQSENERLEKENQELGKNSKEAIRKTAIMDASKKLDNLMANGFTDKQKKFITKQFEPEKQENLSDEGLKTFIEQGKKDFAETAKLFGASDDGTKTSSTTTGEGSASSEDLSVEDEALKLMEV